MSLVLPVPPVPPVTTASLARLVSLDFLAIRVNLAFPVIPVSLVNPASLGLPVGPAIASALGACRR